MILHKCNQRLEILQAKTDKEIRNICSLKTAICKRNEKGMLSEMQIQIQSSSPEMTNECYQRERVQVAGGGAGAQPQ